MKKLSVKVKITLWYTSLMVFVMVLVLGSVLIIGNSIVSSVGRDNLRDAVQGAFNEVEFKDGTLIIDDDLEVFENGIYLSVFDSLGKPVYGKIPSGFDSSLSFTADEIIEYSNGDKNFIVFDSTVLVNGYGTVWIRGICPEENSQTAIGTVAYISLFTLPFIVLLAGAIGYLITKQAFKPVTKITEAAEKINSGNDLTQRIELGEGNDEIYSLALTFDNMFDRLEKSFETEKQFTSDASHELRTPTAVIISQCEYAIENAESLDDAKEALETILGQSKKMSSLISQLLTLARTDGKDKKLNLELVNISELADIVADEQKLFAEKKNIEIRTEITPDIIIRADETMIMRLLINLISNAVRYGKENGYVLVELGADSSEVVCTVKDNGIGISQENLEKIWDRFFQADTARTSSDNCGTGLGLPMAKWIAEAHGGTITVDSTYGFGSTFTFTLPKNI